MRKPIIIANWKMYKTRAEAEAFCQQIVPLLAGQQTVEVAICPTFLQLDVLTDKLRETNIAVGAQNMYPAVEGAFTGEVSPAMLQELNIRYVLIGHSERREIFGESGELIRQKVQSAYAHQLRPVVCVGEHLEQRNLGLTVEVCAGQLLAAIDGLTTEQVAELVVAYEPIWAIGTGKVATADDAEQVIKALRQAIGNQYGQETAEQVRIQYGGSVKPDNIRELMEQPNIDGALVGGASLQPDSFAQIVHYEREA